MSDEELNAIEARAEYEIDCGEPCPLGIKDCRALIAEVRRLRAEKKCRGVYSRIGPRCE